MKADPEAQQRLLTALNAVCRGLGASGDFPTVDAAAAYLRGVSP